MIRIPLHAARLALPALLASCGWAQAQSALLPPPPASVCAAPTVPTTPGDVHMFPGRWWNPQRNGVGWDFFYNDGQSEMYLTWFVYDANGRPVWLHGEAKPLVFNAVTGERTWQSRLYAARWNRNGLRQLAEVGQVSATFPNQTTTRAAISWSWNTAQPGGQNLLPVGAGTYNECLLDTYRDPLSPIAKSVTQLNQAYSSNWFYYATSEHPLGGWGVDLLIDIVPDTGHYWETATAAIFDDANRPTWLQSKDDWGTSAPPGSTFGTTDKGRLRYYRHRFPVGPGQPVHPAILNCAIGEKDAPDKCIYPAYEGQTADGAPTNYFRREIDNARRGNMQLKADVPTQVTQLGNAPDAAAIKWPPADNATPFPATIPVMHYDSNHVIVDKSICRVPDQSTSCTFTVSWVADDPTAQIRRLDLNNNGAASAPLASGVSGTLAQPLNVGDRFQYQLAYTAPGVGLVTLRSPEVRVLLDGQIADQNVEPADCASGPGCDLGTHDASAGAIKGSAEADGGSASYTIPIVIPPGRAGMQPEVALAYSSRGGNGIAGMGWSLSGLSSIHRCPRTVAQDGSATPVTLSQNDALCLDGQRLVVTGGTYGTAGATYRTEIDSFARVTQVGGSLTGNATCFKVEEKSGRVSHYGAVAHGSCSAIHGTARVLPQGAASTLSWQIKKTEDRIASTTGGGNNIVYNYLEHGAGELLIQEIRYTGFGNSQGNRYVTFDYQPRPDNDRSSSYIAGGLTEQTQRLMEITARDAVSYPTTYVLTYQEPIASGQTSLASGRSNLQKIQTCSGTDFSLGSAACLQPTTVYWNDAPPDHAFHALDFGSAIPPATSAPGNTRDPRRIVPVGDLDGDGTRELVVAQNQADNQMHTWLVKYTADREFQQAIELNLLGTDPSITESTPQADIDGDGRADLVNPASPNALAFSVWTGPRGDTLAGKTQGSLFRTITTNVPWQPGDQIVASEDVDGDGHVDLVALKNGSNCTGAAATAPANGPRTLCLFTNLTRHALAPADTSYAFAAGIAIRTLGLTTERFAQANDINGDGISELFFNELYTVGGSSRVVKERLVGVLVSQPANTPVNAACSTSGSTLYRHCSTTALNLKTTANAASLGTFDDEGALPFWTDVNGDGLTDILYATPYSCTAVNTSAAMWCIQLATGTGFTDPISVQSGHEALHLRPRVSTLTFTNAGRLQLHDVNSDGKADVLYPAALAARMCQRLLANYPPGPDASCDIPAASQCQVVGMKRKTLLPDAVTQNCQAEIVMCGDDPSGQYPLPNHGGVGGENTMAVCGQYTFAPDKLAGISGAADFSAYVMKALRFEQTGPAAFRAVVVELDASGPGRANHKVVAQSGRSPAYSADLYGDGLSDLVTKLGCGNGTNSINPCVVYDAAGEGPATLPDGTPVASLLPSPTDPNLGQKLYVNENVGANENIGRAPVLPELVRGVDNGMGARSFWNYAPLSSKAGRISTQLPLYEIVPGEATYADANHFYFQSTMPVVTTFTSSSGIGDIGFRSWRYGYREAIYNHIGRGFQGFRAITKEQVPLSGDIPRAIRTTTTFHQKFPLTGRIAKVEAGKPRGVRDISPHTRQTYDWRCNVLDRGACDIANGAPPAHSPYALTQTTTTFDATSAEADSEVPVSEVVVRNYDEGATGAGLDTFGNPTFTETVAKDMPTDSFGLGRFVESKRTRETSSYYAHDTTNWWVGKLQRNVKTIYPVVWGAPHPLPADASTAQQAIETLYQWNPNRTPFSADVQPNGGDTQHLFTQYEYAREYGLPTAVRRTGKPTDAQPDAVRITSTEYDAEGYFPVRITEVVDTNSGAGLTTEVSHRSKDGQVEFTRSPLGTTTASMYDAFGRVTRIDTRDANGLFSQQPLNVAWNRCSNGNCSNLVGHGGKRSDTLSAQQYASYTTTTVQNGSPTKVVWYDALDREIKTATRSHDGTFSVTLVEYDAMGAVARQSVPFYLTDANAFAPANTALTYDRAGRMTSKRVETKPGVPLLDPAGGNLVTEYAYAGNRTDITVRGANIATCALPNIGGDSRCMRMRRYGGVLGMMYTVDAQGGITRYWSDAAGRPVAIADVRANADAGGGTVAAGRATRATYDELGRRTASADPNQGTWSFIYNAFGELRRQVDARGAITTVADRDLLGRVLAQTAHLTGSGMQTTPGLSRIAMRDEWSYDEFGLLHEARRCKRQDSTGLPPAACPLGNSAWGETYAYDAAGRLTTTAQTQLVYGAQRKDDTTKFHYDANFGREKAVEYPSGLRVQRIFTRFGTLRDVLDADTGERYWGIATTDAWGNITRQDYGNGMRGDYTYSPVSGQSLTRQWRSGVVDPSPVADKVTYTYDSLGNLATQRRDASGAGGSDAVENYAYDSLQRLMSATASTAATQYAYDAAGNFTRKSDFSAPNGYQYSTTKIRGCGPNAAHSVTLAGGSTTVLYTCDANGNIIASGAGLADDRTVEYDVSNRPQHVLLSNTSTDAEAYFAYSPSGERTYELLVEAYLPTTGGILQRRNQLVLRGPRGYELEQLYDTAQNGGWENALKRHEIGDVSVALQRTGNGNGTGQGNLKTVTYKATDRLGSPLGLMDKNGAFTRPGPNGTTVSTRRSFDAFGKTRESNYAARPTTALNPLPGQLNLLPETRSGFTGHEHLDALGLIHMNGRAYDYQLGRFISVDPFVQFPANSQSLNPYSYILNNPLSGKDPTGYQSVGDDDRESFRAMMYAYFNRDKPETLEAIAAERAAAGDELAVRAVMSMAGKTDADAREMMNIADRYYDKFRVTGVDFIDESIVATLREGHIRIGGNGADNQTVSPHSTATPDTIGSLEERAKELHGELNEQAQRRRTTAVVEGTDPETGETRRFVGSSESRLSPAQRAKLQPNETEAKGEGHAEVTAIRAADKAGLKDKRVGASRPVCPSCQQTSKETNTRVESPLKPVRERTDRPSGTPEVEVCRVSGRLGGCGD